MRRLSRIIPAAVVLALVILMVAAPVAGARTMIRPVVAGAAGNLTYTCPFTQTGVAATFLVQQTGGQFKGLGWAIMTASGEQAFTVQVKYVNVRGNKVFFTGPIVAPADYQGTWWYFAARSGNAGGAGVTVGGFTDESEGRDFVANASELDVFYGYPGGLQPIESGCVLVWSY